jgi:SAM-dependent methyltransferase
MPTMNRNQDGANPDDLRYGFGLNWADYVKKHFSDERVEISLQHLLGFLKLASLEGKSFLDIGCGSGLHSLAAWRSGASQVTSFDFDEHAVATTRRLHELSGSPSNWTIRQGSILDEAFVCSLPRAEIVYSWGVLHHTGDMWKAVEHATRCLHDSGMFYLALYSKEAYVSPSYEHWIKVKRKYNQAGSFIRFCMECNYAWDNIIFNDLIHGKNPISHIREYKRSRGMSYWHDVKDWLGGYPMEFAGNKETELFCREKLGLELINLKAGEGNTEFLFRSIGASNYWDDVLLETSLEPVLGPFLSVGGCGWSAKLSGQEHGPTGRLMLYENGSPVGWPNASRSSVLKWGSGRYRVDGDVILFSTTDNSDPNRPSIKIAIRKSFI